MIFRKINIIFFGNYCDPSKYTMGHPDLTVSNFTGNSIGTQRVNVPSTFDCVCLILYAPVNNFQLCRDESSLVEPVLSKDKCVLLRDTMCLTQGHNTETPVMLEPAAHWSPVMHSTTEPLCSLSHQHAFIWCSKMQHNNFILILTSINIFVVVVDSLVLVALDVCGGFVLSLLFCYAVLQVSILVLQSSC